MLNNRGPVFWAKAEDENDNPTSRVRKEILQSPLSQYVYESDRQVRLPRNPYRVFRRKFVGLHHRHDIVDFGAANVIASLSATSAAGISPAASRTG